MLSKELRAKIAELEEWFKDNPKLPPEIDTVLLRRFLKCMDNDIEATKKLIELNFDMRNKNPHIFIDRDPEHEGIINYRKITDLIALPGLTPEGYKILFNRIVDHDPKKLNNLDECKTFHMLADCRFTLIDIEKSVESSSQDGEFDDVEKDEDDEIASGEVQIADVTGYSMAHATRVSFSLLRTQMKFLQEAYPIRLRGMHIINCPSFFHKLVAFMKPFIRDDVFQMIHFHTEGLDSLYEHVPRDMLPEEYGGKAGSIADIKEHWTQQLKKQRDYLMDANQWKVEQTERRGRWHWF